MFTQTTTHHLQEKLFIAPARIIGDLRTYQNSVDISSSVEEVTNTLKQDPDLHGVLLLDGNKCIGTVSRLKIYEVLGRPFGIDLFFKKPIANLFKPIHLSDVILPHTLSIDEAVIKALSRAPEVRYEPVAVSGAEGDLRLLDMNVLLMAQADQLANANRLIEKQVEVGKTLSSTLELSKVFTLVLEQVETIIPFSRAAILLNRQNEVEFAATKGYPKDYNLGQSRLLVNNSEIFRQITQTQQPVAIEDALTQKDFPHPPGIPPTRSWIGIPLLMDNEILGLVSISRLSVAPFTLTEIENSALFAGQAAIALSNANIYQKTQTFNRELETRVRERTAELQKANYKLESLDRNKTSFINFALQEMLPSMISISGFSQVLEVDSSFKKHQRDTINKMGKSIRTLGKIINAMLDVSRLDAQEMELNYTKLNLFSMLIEITEELKPVMRDRQIKCKLKHMEDIPVLLGDAHALRKVFYNIIVNAIKYTPDDGKITIKAQNPAMRDNKVISSAVQITISDTGIGIDPKDHDLIFDKFYQSDKKPFSATDNTIFKGGGSGLGLAIAQGIVQAHGGQIWVESAEQDEFTCPGSSFHVALPIPNLSIDHVQPKTSTNDNPVLTLS